MAAPSERAAGAVFRLVQAGLFPAAVLAYAVFVVRFLRAARRAGTSATVTASLYTRYLQHRLGTRPDELAARLFLAMPGVSPGALAVLTAPTRAAHRLTGHVPAIYRWPYEGEPPLRHQSAARTTFYDTALARHLDGAGQLVVLGAGFDTRSYRLPAGTSLRCFEVDEPRTQELKRTLVRAVGADPGAVVHVPADLLAEDWWERLLAAGFEPARRSVFLWEAVTMYLDLAAVEGTLRRIAGTAEGTAVAFDFFSAQVLESRSLFLRWARAATAYTGEPLVLGLDTAPPARQRIAAFLAAQGLVLEEYRAFGPGAGDRPDAAGFAVAVVGPRGRPAPPAP
ncbi:class I SAM-dependent methyltransferase [Kocuria nitroreducens]|uniref:class I SAM-dependent methyltransferase n=1 Tax=Kocuria nitroreducens TaxID=3058914 RepID=UPI0036D8841F